MTATDGQPPAPDRSFHHRSFSHAAAGTPEQVWAACPEWKRLSPPAAWQAGPVRLVVVAAHPDDETLGAGGLTRRSAATGCDVEVVLLTRGERSHPGSPTIDAKSLGALRLIEQAAALDLLAPDSRLTCAEIPDGALPAYEDEAVEAIVRAVGEAGPTTLLCAPWRHDGHPDHEAAGRAAATAAARTGARLIEYPLWLWHWGTPQDAPWSALHRFDLDELTVRRKADAICAHRSQVQPLSDRPGDEVLLHDEMLAHFRRGWESFVVEAPLGDDALDRLHKDQVDPWQVDTSWYERRKRAVTVAALPRERFRHGLEVGCSTGALTAALAPRCDALTAVDASLAAVESARRRLRDAPHVEVARRSLPEDWPVGRFDLVVVSETGYFLRPDRLRELIRRTEDQLGDDGVVVLCHWRHPIRGWPLDGPRVHDLWRLSTRLPVIAEHLERDFELVVLGDTSAHQHGAP